MWPSIPELHMGRCVEVGVPPWSTRGKKTFKIAGQLSSDFQRLCAAPGCLGVSGDIIRGQEKKSGSIRMLLRCFGSLLPQNGGWVVLGTASIRHRRSAGPQIDKNQDPTSYGGLRFQNASTCHKSTSKNVLGRC